MTTTAPGVKRYSMKSCTSMGEAWQDLEEDADGEYVSFEDYQRVCSSLTAAHAEVTAAHARADDWHQRASQMLIDLTAARQSLTAGALRIETLEAGARHAMHELACLIPVPSDPEQSEWPCENPSDRELLQSAYVRLRAILTQGETR